MFRALTCPSSGGKIVFTQHLVSSLSINVCTVHWLRALNQCTAAAAVVVVVIVVVLLVVVAVVVESRLSTSVLCRRLQRAKIPDAV